MARIVAFVPDLLFGSAVLAAARSSGHDAVLVSDAAGLGRELPGADLLVADLTLEAAQRIEEIRMARPRGIRTLAFYSHVERDVRARAQRAGFDLVVPRSRMAREGPALIARLLAPAA